MPNLKLADLFNNLKAGVLNTKTINIDRNIDKSLATISKYSSNVDRNNYIETIKNIIGNVGGVDDISSVIKDIKDTQVEFFDRSGRIQRYYEFDNVLRHIAYCSRALNALTACIISPDDITKKSINIMLSPEQEQQVDKDLSNTVIERLKNIKDSIDIEKHVDKIVKTTLKKGDYFIEIIHSPKGENALSIINDSKKQVLEKSKNIIPFELNMDPKQAHNENDVKSGRVIMEYPNSTGLPNSTLNFYAGEPVAMGRAVTHTPVVFADYSKDNQRAANSSGVDDKMFGSKFDNEEDKNKSADLKDIFITLHNPKYIIRLETERFRLCLGYLVFPKISLNAASGKGYSYLNNDVDAICMDIIDNLKKKIDANDDIFVDNKELRKVILSYLTSIEDGEDLKVRYVTPEMMAHFRINVDVHDPYGESIFETVLFDCKLLMAMKTSQTIKFLTSSTDKRFISVETGLPRNAKNLVDNVKEVMKKRKISIDKFGSIDSIPSMISTFEDIYLPQRDGKKFVEIDHQQWGPNPQDDIEPLKFIRDNIVADLGVPPAFIGLEENATNRNLLTAESIQFARTIVSFQKEFSVCIHELFTKIYFILYPNDPENIIEPVNIAFPPPKASMYEHELEYVQNAANLINQLKDFGIPVKYLKEKYLSFLDWDAIKLYDTEQKIEGELGSKSDDQEGGMGGGMGGGGGFSF